MECDVLHMGRIAAVVLQVLVGAYGSDAMRYYFAKEVEFGRDGDFAEERFRAIVNADLANTFGNLLNRTLGLLKKNCGGAVPGDAASIEPDHPLRSFAAEQASHEVPCERSTAFARGRRRSDVLSGSYVCRLEFSLRAPSLKLGLLTFIACAAMLFTCPHPDRTCIRICTPLWACRSSWQRRLTRRCAFTQPQLRSLPLAPAATCTWRRSRRGRPSRCPPAS